MSQYFPFVRDDVLPSFWANRIQDVISGLMPAMWLRVASQSSVQVTYGPSAGDDDASNEVIAIPIEGLWRYRTTPVTRAVGGAAGRYRVWATTGPNDITNTPDPFTDDTDYSFDLDVRAVGSGAPTEVPGSVEHWRILGELQWDGSRIVELVPFYGYRPRPAGEFVPFAGAIDGSHPAPTGTVVCTGQLVNIAAYPALFGKLGHTWNGGVDPGGGQFRLPDPQGRTFVGKGTHADVDAVSKSDGAAVASRTPRHSHVVDSHTHTLPNHVHNVPAHYHGKGTLSASGGSHAHGVSDPGHAHSVYDPGHAHNVPQYLHYTGGFVSGIYASWDSAPVHYLSLQTGTYAASTGIGIYAAATGVTVNAASHSHPSAEFAGAVGATGGANGDASFATTNPTSLPASGAATPNTNVQATPFLTGTWLVTTGE